MDARKKGDIYWRKLKRYLEAQKYKEDEYGAKETGLIFAKEVYSLAAEQNTVETPPGGLMLTGDEFKVMPPTSTGEELYKNGIILAIKSYEHFSGILEEMDKSDPVYKSLANMVKTLKNAISTFYEAAGINPEDGSNLDRGGKDPDAEERHRKASDEYDKAVKSFKRSLSVSMIGKLSKESGIEPDPPEEYEDGFAQICDKYGYKEETDKKRVEKIRTEFEALKKKEMSLVDTLPKIKKAVRKISRSESPKGWITYDEAFEEYCTYLDEELRALSFAQKCCYECVKSILSGEEADPLIANYLRNHWGEIVPSMPMDTEVYLLPGYVRVNLLGNSNEVSEFKSREEMTEASEKLFEYRKTHPDKFEFQTISALLFDNSELPKLSKLARSLRTSVRLALGDAFPAGLSKPENYWYKQIWVLADAFDKISAAILLYAQSNETRTIREMLETYASDVYYLSYSRQEKVSLNAIDRLAERGRG